MDIYAEITNRIISELENGKIPWHKPWVSVNSLAVSHVTGKPYSLLNQLMLRPGEYITYNQVQKEGGKVKKGEKASVVVFWKFVYADPQKKEETDESKPKNKKRKSKKEMPEEKKEEQILVRKRVPILRYYNVFHIDQCEGIKPKLKPVEMPNGAEANEMADGIMNEYIDREKIKLCYEEGNDAYYNPVADVIVLPRKAQFNNTAEFYGTAFHEMTHSTGHKSRLNRIEKKAAFGNEEYSKEELVAEIGSSALVHHCGMETPDSFRNSAAYIQSWLRVLRDDKRFVVSAAGKAERAVKFILEGNAKTESEDEDDE